MSGFADMSDDELMKLVNGPVDNLARQKARSVGVNKYTPENLSDEEILAAIGQDPVKSNPIMEARQAAKPKPQRADDITSDELYALGSSPESLKASLQPRQNFGKSSPGPIDTFVGKVKRGLSDPGGELKDELTALGAMGTRALDAASLGYYSKARNWAGSKVAPQATTEAIGGERKFEEEHPFAAGLATGAGYLTPHGLPELAARGVSAGVGKLAAKLPGMLQAPVSGAATGALAGGGIAAGEETVAGGSAEEAGNAALTGAKYGGAIGGGLGAVQGGLGRLAEGANKRIRERVTEDLTDGASAGRRDRVVGKAGEKADRIVSLGMRTPELLEAGRDPVKQKPVIEAQLERVGSQLDEVYDGVMVRPQAITTPFREVAQSLRKGPHTKQTAALADQLEEEAAYIDKSWSSYSKKGRPGGVVQPESVRTDTTSVGVEPRDPTKVVSADSMRNLGYTERGYQPPAEKGYVDARDARKLITDFGKTLFKGNPNVDPATATKVRREVYGKLVDSLGKTTEYFKPGIREELNAANAEMSDWLNMHDAVEARASRAVTPSMSLHSKGHNLLDWTLGVMHPGHLLAKKGLEHYGPGVLRGIDNELSIAGAQKGGTALLQEANPLIRALDAERQRNRDRAETLKFKERTAAGAAQMRKQQERDEALRMLFEGQEQPQN